MSVTGKQPAELFEGLCKVLAENSQPLSEEQSKAISGFIDVLVESINKNWGSTVKEFIEQQKIAHENQNRLSLEKRDKVWEARVSNIVGKLKKSYESKKESNDSDDKLADVMKVLECIKTDMETLKKGEVEKVKEEFKEFRDKSVVATAEAIKVEKQKADCLKQECDKKDGELAEANEKIAQLESALKEEQIKNYLESKISGLPSFEATLLRKRFASAKNQDEIDVDFDKALSSVRERRNVASATMPAHDGILKVQPNQLSETAKATKKVNLLTEKAPTPTPVDPDMIDEEAFAFIDSEENAISQKDMAIWMGALG